MRLEVIETCIRESFEGDENTGFCLLLKFLTEVCEIDLKKLQNIENSPTKTDLLGDMDGRRETLELVPAILLPIEGLGVT